MRTIFIIIAGISLCYMGFYNRFPMVYSDTGAYIRSGFTNEVLIDRPIMYGLFLRHVSLAESLWLVIFVQGFLLAWSIYLFFKYFSGSKNFTLQFLSFLLLILLCTGVSVNVSQLIPDVFTPILILNFVVLALAKDVSRRDMICSILLFLLALTVHNSHFVMLGLFMLVATLVWAIRRWRKKNVFWSPLKLGSCWGLLVGGWLLLCTVHASLGGGFKASGGGHVFLFARMLEMDVAKDYLSCECPKPVRKQLKICDHLNEIPYDFIWDAQSPLYKTGGWEANREEYNYIINDILTSPKYLKRYLVRCVESSFKQFFYFETGDTPPMQAGSSPFLAIDKYYHHLLREYNDARQHFGLMDYTLVNRLQHVLFFVALLVSLLILFSPATDPQLRRIILWILALVLCNAIVCSSLWGVVARYQSRVVWLMVLPLFIPLTQKGAYREIIAFYKGKKQE